MLEYLAYASIKLVYLFLLSYHLSIIKLHNHGHICRVCYLQAVGNPQELRMEPAYSSFISFQFYYIIISFLALIHFRPHILYATHATGPHTFYVIYHFR